MILLLFSKKGSLFEMFEKCQLKEKFNYEHIYPTNHDAVTLLLMERKDAFWLPAYAELKASQLTYF